MAFISFFIMTKKKTNFNPLQGNSDMYIGQSVLHCDLVIPSSHTFFVEGAYFNGFDSERSTPCQTLLLSVVGQDSFVA